MLETLLEAYTAGNKSLAGQDRLKEPHNVVWQVFARREGTFCCQAAQRTSLHVSS